MIQTARHRKGRFGRSLAARLLLGAALVALTTYGPLAAAWIDPGLLGPERSWTFSHQGRDFSVVAGGRTLAVLGFERLEATVMRGAQAISPAARTRHERALAEQAVAGDLAALGPYTGDPFGRGGFILHRHRLGWPFSCVEASAAHVFRGVSATVGPVVGGTAIAPRSGSVAVRGLWLAPWGVIPAGLAGNVLFWAAVTTTPYLIRAGVAKRRRSRDRCVGCGYDLTEAGGRCPECGMLAGG